MEDPPAAEIEDEDWARRCFHRCRNYGLNRRLPGGGASASLQGHEGSQRDLPFPPGDGDGGNFRFGSRGGRANEAEEGSRVAHNRGGRGGDASTSRKAG